MILENIQLKHFRNYEDVSLKFSPNINVFIGENAQGKTNLMESIYVLAIARSHRASKDREMIQFEKDFAKISGRVQKNATNIPLEVILTKKGKRAKVNHLEQARLSDYIGHFNTIIFAPEDLELVKGAPAIRRRFIDMELGQMDAIYLYHLSAYQKILKQRNAYLKSIHEPNNSFDQTYFDVLNDQISLEAAHVMKRRRWFIQQLENWAKPTHKDISQGSEDLTIVYKHSAKIEDFENVDSIYEEFRALLDDERDRELKQATTVIGPHRDDLTFSINGLDVQTYGSQGQQRTTALSLKLAEIDLMKEVTGDYPVLLLDDVLSELDDNRQTHLLKSISNKVQTFLTTTSISGIDSEFITDPKLFTINNGTIEKES